MASPASVCGKYVTGVGRGQEMMDVKKMPMRMAPRTRYIMRMSVKNLKARVSVEPAEYERKEDEPAGEDP
jgi:hypothetical protein